MQQILTVTHQVAARNGRSKRLTRSLLALSLTNEPVHRAQRALRTGVIEILRVLIETGQARGELRGDLPAVNLAEHMVGVYFHALYAWAQSDADDSLHDAIDRTYPLIWGGIRAIETG